MPKKKKKINPFQIITYILYIIVIIFALFALSSKIPIPGNYKLLTVMSGSMEPKIKTGSLIVIKPASLYKINDIVTFKNSPTSQETTTHRIIETQEVGGTQFAITKGDANPSEDSNKVPANLIIGKVIFKIPYLGYPMNFAKTLPGVIILIVIPGTIIIYDEILNIAKELKKKKKRVIKINSPLEVR